MELGSLFPSVVLMGSVVTGSGVAADPSSEPDTRAREALITGKPPRIQPLAPEEITEEMHRALAPLHEATERMEPREDQEPRELPEMLATMIRHPELYGHHLQLASVLFAGTLAPRDRELAILRVAWLCQAPFEWGEHVPIAKRFGVSREEVERVIRGSTAPGWSDHDRAIVRAVEELHGDAMISDATWEVLARDFDEKQLIELLMLVGQYQTVAYYQNALRTRLREGNEGLSAR